MKNTLFLLIFSVFFCFELSAQESLNKESQRLIDLLQKLEGTYQVQIINSREKAAIPLNMLDAIEAMRHNTDTVYYWLKSNTRVLVLPISVINKKEFKGIERITHIESVEVK